MLRFLAPLAAAIAIAASAAAGAQPYGPEAPNPDYSAYPQRNAVPDNSGGTLTCGPYFYSVRCWNFGGLASTGANLFPLTGRPGNAPGSVPMFF